MFEFKKNDTGVEIIGYTGDEEIVVIPETYDGEPITEIGKDFATRNCNIKEVVLPQKVTKINNFAFKKCSKLEKINLPNSLVEVGQNAFDGCQSLTDIKIPPNLKVLRYGMFTDCSSLEQFVVPDNIIEIGSDCFEACVNLKSVTLPNGLKVLNNHIFDGCINLKEITLPSSLETLRYCCFSGCESLEKVVFEGKTISLFDDAFQNCDKLYDIPLSLLRLLTIKQQTICIINAIAKREKLEEKQFKSFLTHIKRKKALKFNLFTTNIPEEISFLLSQKVKLSLDELTLYLEENIQKENLRVTAILLEYKDKNYSNEEVVQYQENLDLVEIGLELPTLAQLKKKWNVGKVEGGVRITGYKGTQTCEIIPKELACGTKVVDVSYATWNNYDPIEHLNIEAEISTLDRNAFNECRSLTSIKLPETLRTIDYRAFFGCSNLSEIELPEGVVEIKDYAFYYSGLEKIFMANSVRVIGENVFDNCNKLKEIVLSDSIKRIPSECFNCCRNLEEITIPKSVSFVDTKAFVNCPKLKLVYIYGNPRNIKTALSNCGDVEIVRK